MNRRPISPKELADLEHNALLVSTGRREPDRQLADAVIELGAQLRQSQTRMREMEQRIRSIRPEGS